MADRVVRVEDGRTIVVQGAELLTPLVARVEAIADAIASGYVVIPQRQLYDRRNSMDGYVLNFDSGQPDALTAGIVFGLTPVKPGKRYCFSLPPGDERFHEEHPLYCYGAGGRSDFLGIDHTIGGTAGMDDPPEDVVWTGNNRVALTIPVGSPIRFVDSMATYSGPYSTHDAADYEALVGGLQFELGSTRTAYQDYSPTDQAVAVNPGRRRGKAARVGDVIYTLTPLNASSNKVRRFLLRDPVGAAALTTNDVVQPQGVRIAPNTITDPEAAWAAGTIWQETADEAAPMLLGGTPGGGTTFMGGGHGAAILSKVTAAAHGKTIADVGSDFAQGGHNFRLMLIAGNDLYFLGEMNVTAPAWNFPFGVTASGTLTHVANATHTAAITYTSGLNNQQMWPSVRPISKSVLVDGVTELNDGDVVDYSTITITDIHHVLNPGAVRTYFGTQVGGSTQPSFVHASIAADVLRTMTYTIDENNSYTCLDVPVSLNDSLQLGYLAPVQAKQLNYSGGKQLAVHVPRSEPIVGGIKTWDFGSGFERIDGTMEELHFLAASWSDANPPDRISQRVSSSTGTPEFGITIGMSPLMPSGAPGTREDLVTDACYISAARNIYVKGATVTAFPRGARYELLGYSVVWEAGGELPWYRYGDKVVVLCDFVDEVDVETFALPRQLQLMRTDVVRPFGGFVLHDAGAVPPAGLTISVIDAPGSGETVLS